MIDSLEMPNYPHKYDLGHVKHYISPFNKVINIRLIGALIPYVPHNIYKGMNELYFNGSQVSIDPGYYTIHTLKRI